VVLSNFLLMMVHQYCSLSNNYHAPALYGTSDAALKSQHSTHAWIISSGQVDDITDPEQNISVAGPVDCFPHTRPLAGPN